MCGWLRQLMSNISHHGLVRFLVWSLSSYSISKHWHILRSNMLMSLFMKTFDWVLSISISLNSLLNTLVGLHLGIRRYTSTYMGRPRVVAKGCEHGTLWAHLDVLATNTLHHTQESCFEPLCMARPLWNECWSTSRPMHTISMLLCWMNQRYAIILFLPQ